MQTESNPKQNQTPNPKPPVASLVPVEPAILKESSTKYIASVDAVIATLAGQKKTGKELILTAKAGIEAGKSIMADCTPKVGGKGADGKPLAPEVKLGMAAVKSRVAASRNSLFQALTKQAGSPDKLTESVIIRQKSVSINTFRTFR